MNYIYLVNNDKNTFEKIPYKQKEAHKIISEIYYLKYRVPTQIEIDELDELDSDVKKFYKKYTLSDIKKSISNITDNIPLFNIYHINIYLIKKENVYYRSVYGNYRFPGKSIEKFFKRFLQGNEYGYKEDPVLRRKIRKVSLMKNFLKQFDIEQLYKSYIDTFTKYSPQFGNLITECSRPSFENTFTHITPYYTRKELINLALNMNLNIKYNIYDPNNIRKICDDVTKNDISSHILNNHNEHIINTGCVSIAKYYTIQGSFFMNQYLRNQTLYSEKNKYLEDNILLMWNMIKTAPEFDNDYYIYRFIDNDFFLNMLKEGDYFIEDGFMSTTRDPFYRNDLYKFGFVLMKIKIPKNVKGIALCLESISLFPQEQEIIFPPNSKFKLINKNKNCKYYNIDSDLAQKINTRYEFQWIENLPIKFKRISDNIEISNVDFLTLKKYNTASINEQIKLFISKYTNEQLLFEVKIGGKVFNLGCEYYNSVGAYKSFYAIQTETGFSIYTIYNGNVLFMIELGEINDDRVMIVNFYLKYTTIDRKELIKEYDFILFLASIAYYFDINNVVIYGDYIACKYENENENENQNIKNTKVINDVGFIQRQYASSPATQTDTSKNSTKSKYLSNYHLQDIYLYLKKGIKRFEEFEHNINELYPIFYYDDLDIFVNTDPLKVLDKEDNDELYQIYLRSYSILPSKSKNLKDFYLWIVDNHGYLVMVLVDKLYRLYGNKINPFTSPIYILMSDVFLYNRNIINHINESMALSYVLTKNTNNIMNTYRDQIETIKKNELF
jgi:hypothetical protein